MTQQVFAKANMLKVVITKAILGKPVAVVGGGDSRATCAQQYLDQVLSVLGVDIVQLQVSVPQIWDKFDDGGRLVDEPAREEIRNRPYLPGPLSMTGGRLDLDTLYTHC